MKIIDAHHHFWNVSTGSYPWLEEQAEWLWGNPQDLPREFLPQQLIQGAEAGGLELVKTVHVQCGYNELQPGDETKFLQGLADEPGSRGYPHGIVPFADISSPDLEEVLSQHCEYSNTRGVRQLLNRHKNANWNMADREYLTDSAWRNNFSLLKKFDLSFDLHLYYHQIDDTISLAHDNSETLFILNHASVPADRDQESIEGWRQAINRLAECENAVAKISGLGMCDRTWTVDSIRPFVLDMIDAFGAERCMFASNFPVDSLFSDYQTVWNAYDVITADFSDSDRTGLFHQNAEKYYRI
tara:strand:+ start:554 stop:1450 length:897 start_codon:yes stop_codon:yes gene_type:complete